MQQVRNVLKKKSSYELTLPIVVDFEDESGYPNYRLSKARLSRQSMMLSVKHLRIKSKQMDLLLDIIQANQI